MTDAVRVEHLKKSYGSVKAVEDVSFNVQKGEIFALLGPNGAGKTTTIRCLCSLSKPDAGLVEIEGISVIQTPKQARALLGYVAQEVALDKILTGRELLELQCDLYHLPKAQSRSRIAELINMLGLEDYQDRQTGTYSGGLKKRLDLAAGLAHHPKVLVLDEPTVGLDIESRKIIWELLTKIAQDGTTVLLSSHYLEEVDALANRLVIIDKGKVIASGSPNQLKQKVGGDRVTLKIREFTPLEEVNIAKNHLKDLPFVEEAIINTAQGNSLNLVIKSQPNALSQIEQSLSEIGFPIFSLAQSRPSLDDVYLAATGQTLLDAEIEASSSRDIKSEKKMQMK
ncbi:MAG: ABC transporter ATP-binding protein [Cyanobacteriota bacterium ELA615]|jgi:ABC-2 type transport system ATP-binding protein